MNELKEEHLEMYPARFVLFFLFFFTENENFYKAITNIGCNKMHVSYMSKPKLQTTWVWTLNTRRRMSIYLPCVDASRRPSILLRREQRERVRLNTWRHMTASAANGKLNRAINVFVRMCVSLWVCGSLFIYSSSDIVIYLFFFLIHTCIYFIQWTIEFNFKHLMCCDIIITLNNSLSIYFFIYFFISSSFSHR